MHMRDIKHGFLQALRFVPPQDKPFIHALYNQKTYGDMNMEFWKKLRSAILREAKQMPENFTERH